MTQQDSTLSTSQERHEQCEAHRELHREPILLREDREAVCTLTLNRPRQYNALSEALISALQNELDALASDEEIRVVIIAAAGKAFCAGHDLKEMRAKTNTNTEVGKKMPSQGSEKNLSTKEESRYHRNFSQCSRMMMSIVQLPQPVIACVQGTATAAGCQLIAMCDLAVASNEARFAVSGVNLGLFCSTPSVALSRNIGRKQAMEMLLTGQFISADEALRLGLINRVSKTEYLYADTLTLAHTIVAKPPSAVRLGKQLFYNQLEKNMVDAYQQASQVMAANMLDEDTREGIDAFIEKREPKWT